MQYIFQINVCTDGDFCLPFVPRKMRYDNGDYFFYESYNDRDRAIEDVLNICVFLKENIYTNRDYVKKLWDQCIDSFVERVKASETSADEEIIEYIGGNYDGTEFIFYVKPQHMKCEFAVTDEEYEMIKENKNDVTYDMIKEIVLDLFRVKR